MEDASFKFSVIRDTIAGTDNVLTVSELCEIAGVLRSGYYVWLRAEQKWEAREAQDESDFQRILEAYRHPDEREDNSPADAEDNSDKQHRGAFC